MQKLLTASNGDEEVQHRRAIVPGTVELPTIWQKPQIIVSLDHYFTSMKGQRIVLKSGFQLIKSAVGWMITGNGATRNLKDTLKQTAAQTVIITNTMTDQPLDVNQFWQLDTVGAQNPIQITKEEEAIEKFERSIARDESGLYSVSWPRKTSSPWLQSNYAMCVSRLKSTLRRLLQNLELLDRYARKFNKQLKEGIIKRVKKDAIQGCTTYLPHQTLVAPLKTTTEL